MGRYLQLLSVLFFCIQISTSAIAQDSAAVSHWDITSKKIDENKYELTFKGTIDGGWQVYAPNQVFSGLKATELQFSDSSIKQENGFVTGGSAKKIQNPVFDNAATEVYEKEVDWKAVIVIKGTVPAQLQGTMLYTYGKGLDFFPSTVVPFVVALEGGKASTARILIPTIDIDHPVNDCGDNATKDASMLRIFILGILGGLIALLTPCVFPMIPVTVTFFTKKSQSRKGGVFNALLYGFFIFLIYVLITLPFHIASKTISPEIFNNISTNVVLNIIFFAIFIVFALSFFGLFEIGLPSGLANHAGSRSGIGNIAGIFFMAGTLAIVSFSCTGPILGTLLTNVAVDGAWPLTAGAAGFGLALGLPFALFAMFPNWLQS
jgi:cytochrome c biogenesis protein CcdA